MKSAGGLRRPGRRRGGAVISLSPQKPRSLPLCRSTRAVDLLPRQLSRRAGPRTALRCVIPRTRRWASAATPTQRDTTQALERAIRASDAINTSNFTSINKPSWQLGTVAGIVLSWLAAGPGRLGDRLFVMNDTEAYWRDWQIVKTRGGLGRRYRDPSFDLPAGCREP